MPPPRLYNLEMSPRTMSSHKCCKYPPIRFDAVCRNIFLSSSAGVYAGAGKTTLLDILAGRRWGSGATPRTRGPACLQATKRRHTTTHASSLAQHTEQARKSEVFAARRSVRGRPSERPQGVSR